MTKHLRPDCDILFKSVRKRKRMYACVVCVLTVLCVWSEGCVISYLLCLVATIFVEGALTQSELNIFEKHQDVCALSVFLQMEF